MVEGMDVTKPPEKVLPHPGPKKGSEVQAKKCLPRLVRNFHSKHEQNGATTEMLSLLRTICLFFEQLRRSLD